MARLVIIILGPIESKYFVLLEWIATVLGVKSQNNLQNDDESIMAAPRCEISNHFLEEIIKLQNLFSYPYFSYIFFL